MNKITETVLGWTEILGPIGPWVLAIIVFLVGYMILKGIRGIVEKLLSKTSFDDKIAKLLGQNTEGSEKAVATFVFYFLLLFLLIFVLKLVGQDEIVTELQGMLNKFLSFVPKLIGAGLILLIAYILAKVVKELITGLLNAANVDERLGTGEGKPITTAVGMVAFFLIILLMLPQALDALSMSSVSEPIKKLLNQIFGYIPNLFGGILLFAIGYLVASIVGKVLANVLGAIGADGLPTKLGYKSDSLLGGKTLSQLVGIVVMATILVIIGAEAIRVMDLGFISDLAKNMVPGYLNILVAVIIFCVAFFIANLLAGLIKSDFWSKVVKVSVIVFLGAVALQKANISSLTNDTFQVIITCAIVAAAFALGVGGAIALGLGGRERAKNFLDKIG